MYRHTGEKVIYGDQRTFGFLDRSDGPAFGEARVMAGLAELRIITGSIDPVQDEEIEVGEEAFRIVQPPRRVGDGLETVLMLGTP